MIAAAPLDTRASIVTIADRRSNRRAAAASSASSSSRSLAAVSTSLVLLLVAVALLVPPTSADMKSAIFRRHAKWSSNPGGGSLVSGRGNFRPGFYGELKSALSPSICSQISGQGGSAMYLSAFKVGADRRALVLLTQIWHTRETRRHKFRHVAEGGGQRIFSVCPPVVWRQDKSCRRQP